MPFNHMLFTEFLVEAKKRTYAAQGDEATVPPLLNDSKQLEYSRDAYFYRDIYFGSSFFAGQETVEFRSHPVWSMVYSGGVIVSPASVEEIGQIYTFLRKALTLV